MSQYDPFTEPAAAAAGSAASPAWPTGGAAAPTTGAPPTAGTGGGEGGMTDTAKEKAGEVAGKAKDAAGQVAGEVKTQARDLIGEARTQARTRADDGARAAGSTMRSASQELRSMAQAGSGGSIASDLTNRVASGLERTASRLDEGGIQGVVQDVESYARRHPGQFLLGAAAAGFVVGRLIQLADTGALKSAVQDAMHGGDDGGQAMMSGQQGLGSGYGMQPDALDLTAGGYGTTSIPALDAVDAPGIGGPR